VELLRGVRTVFGSALVVSIVLGFIAIRRRDIARHRAWMIRGYAIGQGAGTQALISLPWVLATGKSAEGLSKALWLTAGWLINIAIAELIIRNRLTLKRRPWAARRTADLTATAGTIGLRS
jgi:hypothetical protein